MFHSSIVLTGKVNIKKYNQQHQLIEEYDIPNIVTTVGKNFVASRLSSNTPLVMSHMAVGSSQTPQTVGDTLLKQELLRSALFSSITTLSETEFVASFAPPGSGTRLLTEAGIFNSATANAGTMLCRTTFPIITQTTADTIAISWVVSVG
jgi:hypothetical protein